jgi:hypothetical protein
MLHQIDWAVETLPVIFAAMGTGCMSRAALVPARLLGDLFPRERRRFKEFLLRTLLPPIKF